MFLRMGLAMEAVFSEINSRIDPALKEEYKKYTGFDVDDQMIKRYLFLESKAASVDLDALLKRPVSELTGISDDCMRLELRVIQYEY